MRITRLKTPAAGLLVAGLLCAAPVWAQDHGPDHDRGAESHQQHGGPQPSGHSQGGNHEQPQHQESRGGSSHGDARYEFRDADRARLERHYRSALGHVDRDHRPDFRAGEAIPSRYRGGITPAPASIRGRLQAPPAGYSIGYYQGYTVVYDPATYLVLSVIDLLTH